MRRLTFLTVAAFLFSLSMSAQTVDEIIAKNIAAHGGMTRLKAIQSMRLTGDVGAGDIQAGFTQIFKRPMKMRLDVSIQGLTLTQAYDGQNGWQVVPFTGKKDPEPMAADDLKNAQEQADFDGPLMDYKQKGNRVELVGKEKIEGAEAYHLKVTLKNGDVRNLYLNATTFLATKTVAKAIMRGTEVELESTFGDYKEVEGLMFPFSIEQHPVGGEGPSQKITLKKVEQNVPVEDSIFKMPQVAPPPAPAKTGLPPA
jgi:outer membrane lipoprotein-sorting protein